MIRRMVFNDIPQVQKIDEICFNLKSSRRMEGIKAYIEKSDNASIVYEVNNRIIGYNFIHVWGNFAWFGTLGVDPEYRGKGIGKQLLNHTIKFLKEDIKVSNIGLHTMPESQYNVGVYMKLGFKPLRLSLNLKKDLCDYKPSFHSNIYEVMPIDISNDLKYSSFKNTVKTISNKISEGLDLSSQLHLIKSWNFGIPFILKHNDEIKGFALCHT